MHSHLSARFGAGTVATAVMFGLLVPAHGAAPEHRPPLEQRRVTTASAESAEPAPATVKGPASVTLLTGDRVMVGRSAAGEPRVTFRPRPGGLDAFSVRRSASGLYVTPDDVSALVPGVLDPELFNVTGLVDMGYDDAESESLPVILEGGSGGGLARTAPQPLRLTGRLRSIDGAAALLPKARASELGGALAALGADGRRSTGAALGGISRIWLDRVLTASSVEAPAAGSTGTWDPYLDQIGAPAAWDAGLSGQGVTIAVLDSGVDTGHPALDGQVRASRNFTDSASDADVNGHGTHVASIAVGTGAGSDGARRGVAYGADLLAGKVLGDDGRGRTSWIVAGMEWAVGENADVVNLSLGGTALPGPDPLVESLEQLSADSDTLFVVAAGNSGDNGASPGTVNSPGIAPSALTVAAATPDGRQSVFSSEGPTVAMTLKPDVSAPGQEIPGATAGARAGDADLYRLDTGTSQATPLVAGAAAMLLEQHPGWTAEQVKATLMSTAAAMPFHTVWRHGSGLLDLVGATAATVHTGRGAVDLTSRYPDETPVSGAVELVNDSHEAVTLTATDTLSDSADTSAPDSAVTVEPATLTLAPGEHRAVEVTADPSLLDEGPWQGMVRMVDRDGADVVRVPVGVYDEPRTVELTVRLRDRRGAPWDPSTDGPLADPSVQVMNLETGAFWRLFPDSDGQASTRVPPGSYSVFARIVTPQSSRSPSTVTIATAPEVAADDDATVVLDARRGVRFRPPVVARHRTRVTDASVVYGSRTGGKFWQGYTEGFRVDPRLIANGRVSYLPTGTATAGSFDAHVRWRFDARASRGHDHRPQTVDLLMDARRFSPQLTPQLSTRDLRALVPVRRVVHPVAESGTHELLSMATSDTSLVSTVVVEHPRLPDSRTVLTNASTHQQRGICLLMSVTAWRGLCDDLRPLSRNHARVEVGGAVHAGTRTVWRLPDLLFFEAGMTDGEHRGRIETSFVRSAQVRLLNRAGQQLGRAAGNFGYFPIPPERLSLRLVHDQRLKAGRLHMATSTHTVWSFVSEPPQDTTQALDTIPPLLDVDYGPQLAASGAARRRGPLKLRLAVHRAAERALPLTRAVGVRLWWSTGLEQRWRPVDLERRGATAFRATVAGNAWRRGRGVSLRVVAADPQGNRIEQVARNLVPTP